MAGGSKIEGKSLHHEPSPSSLMFEVGSTIKTRTPPLEPTALLEGNSACLNRSFESEIDSRIRKMPPSGEQTNTSLSVAMSDPSSVRDWLSANHPKQLALLDKFEIELRLGRLATASLSSNPIADRPRRMDRRAVTVRTVELLKTLIGGTRWKTPAQLIALLRGLGRELHNAGNRKEPAIGNVVRRIIAAVREEVMNGATADDQDGTSTNKPRSKNELSLESMLWALPQHVKPSRKKTIQGSQQRSQRSESLGDVFEASDLPPQFFQVRPDLKQAVMEAILEITSDLEDLHKNISEQATNHIHAGEIILTYGRSRTVEKVRNIAYFLNLDRNPLTRVTLLL